MHRRNLHPRAEPTPRRDGPILQTAPTFRGGGRLRVRAERHELQGSDRSAAVVHHRVLPRPQRHLNDRVSRRPAQGQNQRHCTGSSGGPQHGTRRPRERSEGNGDCGGNDSGGRGGYDGTFSTAEAHMGKGETDMEHGARGQGRTVTDGLSSRDRLKSL